MVNGSEKHHFWGKDITLGGGDEKLTVVCRDCNVSGNSQKIHIKAGNSPIESSIENSGEIEMDGGKIWTTTSGYGESIEFETSANKLSVQAGKLSLKNGRTIEVFGLPVDNMSVEVETTVFSDHIELPGGKIYIDPINPWTSVISADGTNAHLAKGQIGHSQYALPGHSHSGCVLCPPPACCPSDRRLKENIRSLDETKSLEQIGKLKPVSFYWKDRKAFAGASFSFVTDNAGAVTSQFSEEDHGLGLYDFHRSDDFFSGEQLGFVAQDVEPVIPPTGDRRPGFF